MRVMSGKLEGRVAFISGAARGVGRALALTLANEGADIIAVDICRQIVTVGYDLATPEDLAETALLVEKLGRRIITAELDIRDDAAVKQVIDSSVNELGRLDIACLNAGIGTIGAVTDISPQAWRDVVDTNLNGAFYCARAVIPHLMSSGRGGAIVLTSSATALRPAIGMSHYVSTKHGILGLTKSMAVELAGSRIRVNAVLPTTVNTPMIQNTYTRKVFLPNVDSPTREQSEPVYKTLNAIPIPWIEAEDVAKAVLFLVSDDARYITGVALPVDAGTSLL